jgi:predicted transcriptional regulator
MNELKELTKAEEQVMQLFWKLGKAYVNEVLDQIPEPKPAYNTISTITRILEKKGFIDHEAIGKSHRYFPIVTKREYSKHSLNRLLKGYFSNSYTHMVSFFADEDLSLKDLEEMRVLIENKIQNKKGNE